MAKVRVIPTRSDTVVEELKQLKLTTEKCYGPFGKAMFLQPVPGGHVTVTSYSGNVLQLVGTAPNTPIVQALVTAIKGHINRYYDNGLYISLLCSNLLLKCIELDRPMQIASDVIGYVMKSIVNYIESDSFPCKVVLDWGSSHQLSHFIRSQLATRPVCSLTRAELDHVTSLILKAFVSVLPQHEGRGNEPYSAVNRVHVYTSVEDSTINSKLLNGVLIDNHFTHCYTDSLIVKRRENGVIATAVFGISLAGKQEDTECLDGVQVDVAGAQYAEEYAIQQLLSLAVELVNANVGFVGCQKCMHPAMRELLERNGIIVAEQLSAFHIDSVVDVTEGGTMINSCSVPLDSTCLGRLKNIEIVSLSRKRHLLLEGFKIHSSLMIFSKSDSAGRELKSMCTGIVSSLESGLTKPHLLCGGGCTETSIAHYITQKWSGDVIPEELVCDKRSFSVIVRLVANVFSQVAQSLEHHGGLTLTDSSLHHCWSFPPYDHCEDMPDDSACFSAQKQCNCGGYIISDLPAGSEWLPVQSTCAFVDVIPARITLLLSKYVTHSSQCVMSSPTICDMIEPKIAALTLVGDTTGLLLRTAFSIQT